MALYEIVLAIQFVFIDSLFWLDILFVRRVSFISYLRELFNYTLIGGEKMPLEFAKCQRPVYEKGITIRI